MAGTYDVRDGDSMALIANRLGFRDWRLLYRHPDNTGFRQACPDPNLLRVGTTLVVPDTPSPERHSRRTGEEHTFVMLRSHDVLRLRLQSPRGEPLEGWRYRLALGDDTHEGIVPDGGRIEVEMLRPVATGTLSVWPPDGPEPSEDDEIELTVGGLGPVDEPRAMQARLANLGTYHADPDGDLGSAETTSALRQLEATSPAEVASKHGC